MSLDRDSSIEPLPASRPAARKRPLLVGLLYAHRAIAALLIAAPAATLASVVVGDYPRGDAELFDIGGVMLVEAARLSRRSLAPLAASAGLTALVAAALGLIPLAILIAGLGREGPLSARFLGGRAARSIGPLSLLWGATLLAQVILAALILLLGQKVIELARLDYRGGDIARAAVFGLAGVVALCVGVLHDLARVAVVHEGRGFYMACARAFGAFAASSRRVAGAYLWRSALSIALLIGAAWLAHRVGVVTGPRLALGAVIHQASIAAAVFLRASWLAAAIAILGPDAQRATSEPLFVEPAEPTPPPNEPAESPNLIEGDQIGCEDRGA